MFKWGNWDVRDCLAIMSYLVGFFKKLAYQQAGLES